MTERLSRVTQVWVDDDGKEREAVTEYDEQGAAMKADASADPEIPQGELPEGFPGRDILRRAGYNTVEVVRQFRRRGPLTRIEGIDSLTSEAIVTALALIPEDKADAAQATSADAKAQGVQTKVSEGGGGSEAESPVPPAPGPIPAGKPGTGEMSAKAASGRGVPAQASQEGFIKSAGPGSHLGTNLTAMDGATETVPANVGELAETDEKTAPPEPNLSLRGTLPDGFPHAAKLREAGLDTYGKVRAAVKKGDRWYEGVQGIGEKTAPSVLEALAAKPEEEDEDE